MNPHDSKHHLLSSELDYQQQRSLEPNVQENSCVATTTDELSSVQTMKVASFEQNEKNVTGLDLLSMVDGGSSEKSQSSSLGRCTIPVCDLISDTGSLSHVKSNSKCVQKLPPGGFQGNRNSLIGFDLALAPATACNLSVDCSTDSCTEIQTDGEAVLCSTDNNAIENLNQLVQMAGSYTEANVVDSANQERTATLNNKVFNQFEQIIALDDRTSALIMQPVSIAPSSKDDTLCEKLSCEPSLDENIHCAKSQMIARESSKQAVSEDDKTESVTSNPPKICNLNKNSLALSDASLPAEHILVLDKTPNTEEKLCNPGQNAHQVSNTVSTPEVSEDLETSLSCLPLAVSICGSFVTSEDKNGQMVQDDTADVISDATVRREKHKTGLPKWALHGIRDASELEENLSTASHSGPEEAVTEREKLDNTSSKSDLLNQQEFAATFSCSLDATLEACSSILPTDIDERASVDLGIEEDMLIENDMLVSDAELDAFLSEHCLQSSSLKPLKDDTDDELLNVAQDNLVEANKPNNKSDCLQTETEFKQVEAASADNYAVSGPEPKMGILAEKSTLQVQKEMLDHRNETRTGVSNLLNNQQIVHSGGARPKQLLNLPPKAKNCNFNSPNTLESEPQGMNCTVPNNSLSGGSLCPDSSSNFKYVDTQNFEGQVGSVASAALEPAKVVEQAVVLGQKQPSWVPDSEAPNCMNCQAKFTFTKRRHHCRACGKVSN